MILLHGNQQSQAGSPHLPSRMGSGNEEAEIQVHMHKCIHVHVHACIHAYQLFYIVTCTCTLLDGSPSKQYYYSMYMLYMYTHSVNVTFVPVESCVCVGWAAPPARGPDRGLRGTSQSAPDQRGSSPLSGAHTHTHSDHASKHKNKLLVHVHCQYIHECTLVTCTCTHVQKHVKNNIACMAMVSYKLPS